MGEILVVKQPSFRMFREPDISIGEFRKVIHQAYFNCFGIEDVPTTDYIAYEDEKSAIELYYNAVNMITFGEYIDQEDLSSEDEKELTDNEEAYIEDFKFDIETLLYFDNMVFIDQYTQLQNAPFVKIW